MTTGEDSTRRTVDDGAAIDAGAGDGAPRRLPTFPYRGVTDTSEIPLQSETDPQDLTEVLDTAEIAAAAPPGDDASSRDADAPSGAGLGEDDATDSSLGTAAAPAAGDGAARRDHAHRPRPAGLIVTVAAMSVALLAAGAVIAYLWQVTEEWQTQYNELTGVSYGIGAELATEREALAEAERRIDLLNDQLSASKDTVTRLQAENAQWGDDAAFAQERIAALETRIADATTVSNALTRCIDGQRQLVGYLEAPDTINPNDLTAFEFTVTELCASAQEAHLTLQQSAAP